MSVRHQYAAAICAAGLLLVAAFSLGVAGKGASEIGGKSFALEVARGRVPGLSFIHKFGEASDIDTADGLADIWDGSTDSIAGFTGTPSYTYSSTADIDSLSSSSGSDTTDVEVLGLDTNWDAVTQTITLTGQTRVALTTDLIRVFRMRNVGAAAFAGNVFCYVDGGGLTAGVPDTEADVRAIIQIGNENTLMALYTIPNSMTGYMDQFFASISQKKNQISDIEVRFRPNGGVFRLMHRSSLQATGTSDKVHPFFISEVVLAKTDIAIRADTSADNGAISAGFDVLLVDD